MWTSLLPGNTSTPPTDTHSNPGVWQTHTGSDFQNKELKTPASIHVFSLCHSLSTICSLVSVSTPPSHHKTHTRPPKHDPRRLQLTDPAPHSSKKQRYSNMIDAQFLKVNQCMVTRTTYNQGTSQEQWLQLNQWALMRKHQTNSHICFLRSDGVLTLYLK